MSDAHFLAVEIGGTKIQVVAGDASGRIVDRRRFLVDRARGAAGIQAQLLSALPDLVAAWRPRAIGVGYGGPVDWRNGIIRRSYHIEGWTGFPLGPWLTEQTGLPAFVDNDANVAALGEARHGAGRGRDPVFYITVGSGVGGGIITGGHIYHGAPPSEVEIGHIRLDRAGTIVEDRCSGWSLNCIVIAACAGRTGPLADAIARDPGHEARHLGPALAAGDPLAAGILEETTGHLAYALGHLTQLFHPEVIVLGGGVSLLGEPYRAALERQLPAHIMDVFRPGPALVLSALKEDAVPVGALALACERLLEIPRP